MIAIPHRYLRGREPVHAELGERQPLDRRRPAAHDVPRRLADPRRRTPHSRRRGYPLRRKVRADRVEATITVVERLEFGHAAVDRHPRRRLVYANLCGASNSTTFGTKGTHSTTKGRESSRNGTCPVVSFSCTWYRAAVTRPTHRHSLCATQSPSRNREIGDTCDTSTSFTCRESRRKRGRVPAQVWASLGADVGESRRRCGRVSAHHARAPLPSAEPERREFQLHLNVCHRAERGERIAAESYRVACAATHSAVRSDATAPQVKYPEYRLSLEYPRSLERHPQP